VQTPGCNTAIVGGSTLSPRKMGLLDALLDCADEIVMDGAVAC